jgi:hypothetical protein
MTLFQYPWDIPAVPKASDETAAPNPKPRGRRPASARAVPSGPDAVIDCLYHHLTVSGPAEDLTRFAAAARGSGITPWWLDGAAIEEDIFVRAVSVPARRRSLSVAGCRILARQFRDRFEAHHARTASLIGRSLACPFDLHVLLPVPPAILQLSPADPAALAWLRQHWGTAGRLRQVEVRADATTGRRIPRGHAVIGYGFFTGGDTPRVAVDRLATAWPALRFALVPRPPD